MRGRRFRFLLSCIVVPLAILQVIYDFRLVAYLIALGLTTLVVLSETGRRRALAERAESARREDQLRYAQAAAHIGAWEVHDDGSESWSPTFCELLGVPNDIAPSTELFRQLVLPEDYEAVNAADEKMLNEEGEHEFEYRINRHGEVRHLLARGRCIFGEQGKRVHGVAIDITERKLEEEARHTLEQQLVQAQKLETIGRLAGGIAHDFNNVLTGISGYAELARARAENGSAPLSEIDEISAGAERAAALTRQLLAFSRKQVMAEEVLDLNEIIRRTDGLLGRVIGEDIRVEHQLHQPQVLVSGDRTQLEQVVLNLVVNARDAMPGGGRITIEVDEVVVGAEQALDLEPGGYALLAVSDTGSGIEAQTVAEIFEPFFTTKADGTGLGLATVHGIVKQSGGTIWVYSEPGAGATFKIYLPLAEGAVSAVVDESEPATQEGGGEHVLVIEDDRQVRSIVKQMLARRGYVVTTAGDPVGALAAAASGTRFDVILSDLVMPDKGGRELVAELRVHQPEAGVIFMSGYSDDAVRMRGVLEPGAVFIEKPFSSDELVRKISMLLDRHEEHIEQVVAR